MKKPALRLPLIVLLLLCASLLVGQEDCNPDPPPNLLPKPLALDCSVQGNDFYLPVDLTVQRDRIVIIAGPGFFADVWASVLLPAETFCAFTGPGNPTAVDVTTATMTVQIGGVSQPVPSRVTLAGSALPTNIDLAAACAGAYGPGVPIDFAPTTTVPWPDGAATVDFFHGPSSLAFVSSTTVPCRDLSDTKPLRLPAFPPAPPPPPSPVKPLRSSAPAVRFAVMNGRAPGATFTVPARLFPSKRNRSRSAFGASSRNLEPSMR